MKAFPIAIVLLLFVPAAHAVRLEQPYTVEVPVASQARADRQGAERAGLLLLLERLSGRRVDDNPAIVAAAAKADRYLQQFSYQQAPTAGSTQPLWRLRLTFTPEAVNPLLEQAGLALWPLDRPRVLLLMADDQGGLLPVPAIGGTVAIDTIAGMGQARGLPLLVPDPATQDLTVAAAVQTLDAAALLPQVTAQKADALLLGSVSGSDEKGWRSQWLLHAGGQEQQFQQQATTFTALVDNVLRETASQLSARYRSSAVADMGSARLRLQVDGIRNYSAYTRLRQYLENLEAVEKIENTQINGTTVIVDLSVKGRESFRNLTALFRLLQWREEIVPPPGSDPSLRPVWRYEWSE